ncbi:serine/threonine protein kinase [Methanoregula sp.]|uniref:serine/threonine protein kinase n=1 Tax=Methanoregula sp. TaxID=2052170 RepID=UPI003C740068
MIKSNNPKERVDILHHFNIFNYNSPLDRWCWLLRNVEYDDVISRYNNPILIYQGGQRIVFKVTDPEFGTVALKIGCYRTPQNPDGWDIERIEREIGILRQIESSYFPKNFKFEKISNDRYLILEEFIESVPLSHCMDKFQEPNNILILIKYLVTGLEIIWNKNIVHRDLKPDNILIPSNGIPKIIDLGIARSLDSTTITRHLAAGPCTPFYAAPELLRYDRKLIDKRTDQYNLGIILVQLLLKGTHPFDPTLVGGQSIPYNILSDNWYRKIFDDPQFSKMGSIASTLLGFQQYQRFRTSEMLLNEINSCLRLYP